LLELRLSERLVASGALAVLGLLFLGPLLWLIMASVDARATWALSIPHPTASHFAAATRGPYMVSLVNTFMLSLIATAVSTVAGVLGGYALSRRRIPLRDGLMVCILFLTAVPVSIMIIPVFQMFSRFDLLGLTASSVFIGVLNLPFSLWLIKTAVDTVPRELEEAALIEQASLMQVVLHVTIPAALPGIAAAAIYSFISAWGSFMVPFVLINDPAQSPASLQIFGFIRAIDIQYGNVAAFSIIYSLPVILLYLLMSRLFTGGFVMGGAVKG
jgi:multiple sugar transport system permease protein